MATLVFLGLLLALTPLIMGCGGSEEEVEDVIFTVGVLTDFSGGSASAVVPTMAAFEESILYYQEKEPIKGLRVKFQRYDHQFDYSKTVAGYQELTARGMNLLYAIGPTERDMLQSYLTEDHMPCIGSSGRMDALSFPWIWNVVPTYSWQVECALQFIADTWDYSGGPPKIAHQGWVLAMTDQYQAAIDSVLNDPAWAGKFQWVGVDRATTSNVTWNTSYQKFQDCDFIICSNVGNSVATFVGQMRALGYTGSFISGTDQFTGYWNLVQANTPAAGLYGCYYTWWGPIVLSDSDADWFQEMTATTKANHDDWAARLANTGPITGWFTGAFVYDAIGRAAEEAGPSNVDGDALKAALDATDIAFDETGNTLHFPEGCNTGLWTMRVAKWNVDESRWQPANDTWYEALSAPE